MNTFSHILCPVDFSTASDSALATAIDLATRLKAEIHLIHIYQYPAFNLPETDLSTPIDASMEEEYSQRLQSQLESLINKYSDSQISISCHLAEGVPYAEIINSIEKINADLIVMGTHGRTGLAHMLLGSVTERVVRSSPIPVLSVPEKK